MRGSNLVAIILVKIPFVGKQERRGNVGVVWLGCILRLRVQCMILLGRIRERYGLGFFYLHQKLYLASLSCDNLEE